jgi:8-oxo-dGTP diphosphatase
MIEKTNFGDISVELKWIPIEDFFKLGEVHISSCFSIPIMQDQVLMTLNPRGWDFIGGHTENNETPFDTMVRESVEEASIKIIDSNILGAIEVVNPDWNENSPYPKTSYQLFYSVTRFNLEDFDDSHECSDRQFFELNEIEEKHHNLLSTHKEILKSLTE